MTTSDQQGLEEQERRQREEAQLAQDAINAYADAMIRRDKEKPQWLRDSLTGARDEHGYQGGY